MTLLYLSYFFGSSINKKRVSGKLFFSESQGFQVRFLFFIGPFAPILRMLTCCPGDDLNIKVGGKPLSSNSPLYHEATRPYCMALRRGYA